MNARWLFGLLILIFCGALALRVPRLDLRPMHGDEAVHAIKFNSLWSKGEYRYDPREYHGPILYDFALPVAKLSGARDFTEISATTLRLVPVCFGALLIGWFWLLRDGFGQRQDTILWAAIFTAISPVMVFYSRYFIQEIPLVFFTLGFIACLWRTRLNQKSRSRLLWCLGAGVNAGLMLASKETALIALTCVLLSWFLAIPFATQETAPPALQKREWLLIFCCAVGVAVSLLSNFGRSFPDLGTLATTVTTYFLRAGGQENQGELHQHSWFQYFEWLFWYRNGAGPRWSEALIGLLFLVGLGTSFRRSHTPLARFFAIYTLSMMTLYSALPYKTPWCVLGFWSGAIVVAGYGVSQILAWPKQLFTTQRFLARVVQSVFLLALTAGCWNLWQQAQLSNTRLFADRRNPWVYAHPTRDVLKLGERVKQLAALHPQKNALPIVVVAPGMDYWPLPWELRAQTQVGYFDKTPLLNGQTLPLLVLAKPNLAEIQQQMGPDFERRYHVEYYGLRPGIIFGLCVENGFWQKFLDSRQSE